MPASPCHSTSIFAENSGRPSRPALSTDAFCRAGDGFVAGYLADRLLGRDVVTRLTTVVTVGAYACLVPGGTGSVCRAAR